MNIQWLTTLRLDLPGWGPVGVPTGHAVVEVPEGAESLPDGAIRLRELGETLLLAIPAPGIRSWLPRLFGFGDREDPPTIPPTDPHPNHPKWHCRVCGKEIWGDFFAALLWAEDERGALCSDHLSEAFAPARLLYPAIPLMEEVEARWHRGEPVQDDPVPAPGPWPPIAWIPSEEIRETFAANQGAAPPVQIETRCPACGAAGPLSVQETVSGRDVKAPCSHLEQAVEILARGPLVFAWGYRHGWTILPAGLVGPMGYRFASPVSIQILGEAKGIYVGWNLSEAEYLALARPAHLPCGTTREEVLPEDLIGFLAAHTWVGREIPGTGVIFFHPLRPKANHS